MSFAPNDDGRRGPRPRPAPGGDQIDRIMDQIRPWIQATAWSPQAFSEVRFVDLPEGMQEHVPLDAMRLVTRLTRDYLASLYLSQADLRVFPSRNHKTKRNVLAVVLRGHHVALRNRAIEMLAQCVLACEANGVSLLRVQSVVWDLVCHEGQRPERLIEHLRSREDLPMNVRRTLMLCPPNFLFWQTDNTLTDSYTVKSTFAHGAVAQLFSTRDWPSIVRARLGELMGLERPRLFLADDDACIRAAERLGARLVMGRDADGWNTCAVDMPYVGPEEEKDWHLLRQLEDALSALGEDEFVELPEDLPTGMVKSALEETVQQISGELPVPVLLTRRPGAHVLMRSQQDTYDRAMPKLEEQLPVGDVADIVRKYLNTQR